MPKKLTLVLKPKDAFDPSNRMDVLRKKLGVTASDIVHERGQKRSIDARSKEVKVHYETVVYVNEEIPSQEKTSFNYDNVSSQEEIAIIGAGPAGIFAALRLIEQGKKPIIIERGKDVRERRRDLAAITKKHIVNPDSNYCFGEGGAGTYSDGKLYTRSKKRGSVQRILDSLIYHGAPPEIRIDAHPHIGTNKLPQIITSMRKTIEDCGGEFRFNSRLIDMDRLGEGKISLEFEGGEKQIFSKVILATGHSARDIYELFHVKKLKLEAKPFAMGVRVEHPQEVIDQMQYHCADQRDSFLPAASYALVHQSILNNSKRGVFSFCMCPGGFIVPSATAPGEVVVNGMSPSKRDSKYANSGIVIAVELEDLSPQNGREVLAGLDFQKKLEQKAWQAGGQTQKAPAQRMVDFVQNIRSNDLNSCSYVPGLESVNMREVLGKDFSLRLKSAFKFFGKQNKAYYTNEANVVGVESRSSSPVRIRRDPIKLHHLDWPEIYPCGEGAGYAGGIVSAAMDGEKVAEAITAEA